MRSVAIERGLCRSGRARRSAWAEVRRRCGGNESKTTGAGRGGKTAPLGYQEPISCNTECCVMVEASPVATFKVPQSQFLLQFLIIPLDDPAVLGHFDQGLDPGVQRQRGYPVLTRFSFPSRPFDQATIPPREVPLFRNPDEQDVHERRQSGIATSGLCLRAR